MKFFRRQSKVVKVLLSLLLLAFIIWGIGGELLVKGSNNNNWVVKVGDMIYTPVEFARGMEFLQNRDPDKDNPNRINAYKERLINEFIDNAILSQEAENLGIFIDDEIAKEEIANMKYFQDKEGNFSKKEFDQIIKSLGLTESGFIEKIKQQIVNRQLINIFLSPTFAMPSQFSKLILQSMYAKRVIKLYKITPSLASFPEKPTDKDLMDFFESNKNMFSTSEIRKISYLIIDPNIVNNVNISQEEIEKVYKDKIEVFYKPERRSVKQIVVPSQDEAQKVYQSIMDSEGKQYDAIVKDLKQNQEFIEDLGEVTKDGFDDNIGNAIFALKEGEISSPIQTPLGWNLFMVTKIYLESIRPLKEVEAELKKEIEYQKTFDILNDIAKEMHNDISLGLSLDEISNKYNIIKHTAELVNANYDLKNIPIELDSNFRNTVFNLKLHETSDLITISSINGFTIIHIDDIVSSKIPNFDSIKTKLIKSWYIKQNHEFLFHLAESIKILLNKGQCDECKVNTNIIENQDDVKKYDSRIDYNKYAEIYIKKIKPELISIDISHPPSMPKELLNDVLDLKVSEVSNVYEGDNSEFYFAKLESINYMKQSELEEYEISFGDQIAKTYREIIVQEYLRCLKNKYTIQINNEILKLS